ncbi:hypothetical protein FAZ95_13975 [Trinickia violacea]|uniref:Uncharacterized protein n=1 Tax=Trinickia violacea TaxID=2571746 RepID=A0A4V1EHG5_9BURK|nr:hypothetical protein [Trinickia violacea]QCP50190.1 hypothetical protein FAZ95_13975 [Trinickia violacea]
MTLDQLFLWHREQHERFANLAENNKANLPQPYKASLKRTYEKQAKFHSQAVAQLNSLRQSRRDFPEELTDNLREALGWPNFRCGPVAYLMRAAGAQIEPKAEDEQAAVLHWFVKLVLKHGNDWWTVARDELAAMRERVDASEASGARSDA